MTLPDIDPVTFRLYNAKTGMVGRRSQRRREAAPMEALVVSHSTQSLGLCRLPPLGRTGGSGKTPPLDHPRKVRRHTAATPAPTDAGAGAQFNRRVEPEDPNDLYAPQARGDGGGGGVRGKMKDFGKGMPQWSPYYKPDVPELQKLRYFTPASVEYGAFTEVDYLQDLAASMDKRSRARSLEIAMAAKQ